MTTNDRIDVWFAIVWIVFAIVALVVLVNFPPGSLGRIDKNVMGDVDTWAGLSSPSLHLTKPAAVARERASRIAFDKWALNEHQELTCLTLNIYHEARGEPWEGQVAVAEVTLERTRRAGGGVCKEVYRPAQFSWTDSELRLALLPRGKVFDDVQLVASASLERWHRLEPQMILPEGTTYFHTSAVNPRWSRSMEKVAVIGAHRFFRG